MPTPILQNNTPLQCLFCVTPKYTNLHVFGCLCYPWLQPYTSHKLDPKCHPCVFLGFSSQHHASKCLDISNNKIYLSRYVTYHETTFPFQTHLSNPPSNLGSLFSSNRLPHSTLTIQPTISPSCLSPPLIQTLYPLPLLCLRIPLFHCHLNQLPIYNFSLHYLPHIPPPPNIITLSYHFKFYKVAFTPTTHSPNVHKSNG